jgi:hypothetical protein
VLRRFLQDWKQFREKDGQLAAVEMTYSVIEDALTAV